MMDINNLSPCRRVGLNITKRCNWKCQTCFYRYREDFNTAYDAPLVDLIKEIEKGKTGGCNHVVAVGWGEPMLYPDIEALIKECNIRNMTFSMITNGTSSIQNFERLYSVGLDHLHISVHGEGDVLNAIAGSISSARQSRLLKWLSDNKLPWRSNTTLQKLNYRELPNIAEYCVDYGVRHFVMLGFLPHYEWSNDDMKQKEVAVHPAELRPYIEQTAKYLEERHALFTIRYHPFCHLDKKYWKYVTNTLYVVFDPWEWCYNDVFPNVHSLEMVENAFRLANGVSINTEPCLSCAVRLHCGGWNRTYASAFDGAGLKSIKKEEIDEADRDALNNMGHFFCQNPANAQGGYFKKGA